MMNSSDANQKKILRVKKKSIKDMEPIMSELTDSLGQDDLEAFLVLPGDTILKHDNIQE